MSISRQTSKLVQAPKQSPVKIFEFGENFCFTFLYGPMNFRKILVHTTKSLTSPQIPDFQNCEKSP